MKLSQSVSKRTRSRGKQTSPLDFDVPKKRPTAAPAAAAVASEWPHDVQPPASANDAPGTKKKKTKKKRSNVCLDVTTAEAKNVGATLAAAKTTGERKPKRVKLPLPPQEGNGSTTNQQQLVITPSPHLLARKKAGERNAAALELSVDTISSGGHGVGGGSTSGDSSSGVQNVVFTPHKDTDDQKKEIDDDNDTAREEAAEGTTKASSSSISNIVSVNRSVTIDPLDTPINPSQQQQLKKNQLQNFRPTVPAFNQQWKRPYAPCLAPTASNDDKYLPPGVIDIDIFPHQCCAHSHQSHGEYSWITSKRRCGCVKDSNHCSAETLTEAYLGAYGVERYGNGVGMAGSAARAAAGTKEDWSAERWWLDQTGKETGSGRGANRSTPSPTLALSDAGSLSDRFVREHLDYMPRQPHIDVEMRRILVDWLLEVAEEYKLGTETSWLGVALVDRSLACAYDDDGMKERKKEKKGKKDQSSISRDMIVQKDKLQLVGCACLLMASKLNEINPPTAEDMVYISDKTYTQKDILDTEATVCAALKFRLNFRTPFHYVDRFLRASHASSESSTTAAASPSLHSPHVAASTNGSGTNNANNTVTKKLVLYLLDLAVLEYKLVSERPGLVAAAAVYLARATLGVRAPPAAVPPPRSRLFETNHSHPCALGGHWSKTLEYYTGYDEWDLEEAVRLLHRLQENAEDNSLSSIFNKHKGSKCKKVALKTVVSEEQLGFL